MSTDIQKLTIRFVANDPEGVQVSGDHLQVKKDDLLVIEEGGYGVTVDEFVNNTRPDKQFSGTQEERAKLVANQAGLILESDLQKCPEKMRHVPGGGFEMGSNQSDAKPHYVMLSDFCADSYEFTNGDYDRYKQTIKLKSSPPRNMAGPRQPLVMVSWFEADALCEVQWKRLPREAEWEYMAKGGRGDEYATSNGQYEKDGKKQAYFAVEGPSTVGSYPPNPFGLYDLSGNASEWVADWYGPYEPQYQENPTGPNKAGKNKALRGFGVSAEPIQPIPVALRGGEYPEARFDHIGFRCVSAPKKKK